MPQSKYTDADLPRFERKAFTKTIVKRDEEPSGSLSALQSLTNGPSVEQRLANAKGTLASSGRFLDGIDKNVADEEDFERRQASEHTWGNDVPSVTDSAGARFMKNAKHYIATRPEAIEKGALAGVFSQPEIAVPSMAVLGLRSAANLAEGGMQRVKEHPVRTALDVAGVAGGAGAGTKIARALMPAMEEAPAAARALGEAPSLAAAGMTEDVPLYKQMERLPARTTRRIGSALPEVRAKGEDPRSIFQQMEAAGDFAGDRTTGQFDGSSGLSSIPLDALKRLAGAKGIASDIEPVVDEGIDLSSMVAPPIRGRATNAAGRAYLSEGSSLPENATRPSVTLNGQQIPESWRPLVDSEGQGGVMNAAKSSAERLAKLSRGSRGANATEVTSLDSDLAALTDKAAREKSAARLAERYGRSYRSE